MHLNIVIQLLQRTNNEFYNYYNFVLRGNTRRQNLSMKEHCILIKNIDKKKLLWAKQQGKTQQLTKLDFTYYWKQSFGKCIFRRRQYVTQYCKVRDGEIKDLRNTTGLQREKFRRDYNQGATNKYLHSTTYITRATVIMAMGNYKVGYLTKIRSRYGDFIVVGRWYYESVTKNLLKLFVFDRAIFKQRA